MPSKLLSLPAEMRNRIYREVLVELTNINIARGSLPPPEPGLLQVNRQVRQEAIDIYYAENTFRFYTQDYDVSVYHKWAQRSIRHRKAPTAWTLAGGANWRNVLQWLRWFYDKECNGLSPRSMNIDDKDDYAVGQLFQMVQERQRGMFKTPWEQLEVLLEQVHQVMAALKKEWA